MNYLVVLFKNKKRKKIIKSFVTKKRAEKFFKDCVDASNDVKFNVMVENAQPVNYEIALLSSIDESQLALFKQDDWGRNVKIEMVDSDYKITKIENYNIGEKIFDWKKNRRISFDEFWGCYFNTKELKSVYTVNNKIIIQKDDDINLFSLKNSSDSVRFLNTLNEYMVSLKRTDGLFVRDLNTVHRKYLYKILEDNGFDKKRLYRQSTTFSERK